jgi:hypothetical protein
MLVLAPAACCLAGLALSEVTSYLAASLAASQAGAADKDGKKAESEAGEEPIPPTPGTSKKAAVAASAAAAERHSKKGGRAKKPMGTNGGWMSGSWRPLPRDVAIVGLILVFAGLR